MKDTRIQLFNADLVSKAEKIHWYWVQMIKQIAKDFDREDLASLELEEVSNQKEHIVELLKPLVLELLETRIEYFFALLYRIDIPEKKVKELLPLDKTENALDDLTMLIIEREFLKVLIKDYIKNQKLRSDV
jgi:hypothetical protein